MAEKRNIQDELRQMTDPVAYREETPTTDGFDWTKLKNADVNISQYWDDSSAANYNNPALWGWENAKYEWENTKNSQVAYDPNATIEWLDPNYKYGREAQMANSEQANYIATRNDQIASALYNAWKTSIQDVSDFLSSQSGFYNSNDNERANTINAVWKRLWQMTEQNKEEEKQEVDESWVNQMEQELNKDTTGKLYGKSWADADGAITTLSDSNSVYKAMAASRVSALKSVITMTDSEIAVSLYSGITPYSEQAMRDFMQYYPDRWANVQQNLKKLRGQDTVNAITNGTYDVATVADSTNIDADKTSYAVENSNWTISATSLLKSIDSILESNTAASSAQETMDVLEKDMAKLKNRLQNLTKEANQVFKWDVPDYIVKAYVNNKSQEIQNNLSILEDRYNAAYNRYKTELANAQWEAEYNLKKEQLQLEKDEFEWKKDNTETTSSWSYGSYRTERNNNPTAMITDYAKMLWGVLWEDYEIGDSFLDSKWNKLYTAKLIGDPIEKTIELLDRWLANWLPNIFVWWSYAQELWLNNNVWKNATDWEKRKIIEKMLKREWGSMANMAYYKQSNGDDTKWVRWDWKTFDLTGSATYNNLSARDKDWVKGLLNLQISKASVLARKNDYDSPSLIFNAVTQINPSWTENDIWQADKYVKDWNKWLEWGWLDRAATAWGMAKELYDYVDSIPDDQWNSVAQSLYDKLWIKNIAELSEIEKNALEQIWDTRVIKLKQLVDNLVAEYAGAMKWWNASLSWEEVLNRKGLFSLWFTKNQMKTAATATAEAVYDKVVTWAQQYRNTTMKKPMPIWLDHWDVENADTVVDWMATLRPSMSYYFQYSPVWWNAPTENYDGTDILAQNWL